MHDCGKYGNTAHLLASTGAQLLSMKLFLYQSAQERVWPAGLRNLPPSIVVTIGLSIMAGVFLPRELDGQRIKDFGILSRHAS